MEKEETPKLSIFSIPSELGKIPEKVREGMKKGLQGLEKILQDDPEGKHIQNLIQWNLRGDVKPTSFPDLRQGLLLSYGPHISAVITNLIGNNNPKLLELYEELGISKTALHFLRNLLTLYGSAAKRAQTLADRPNDWTYAHSYFYSDEKRGIIMRTELTKGNGETISFDSSLNDCITLAYHILKNINRAEIEIVQETETGPKRAPIVALENFQRLEQEFQRFSDRMSKEFDNTKF